MSRARELLGWLAARPEPACFGTPRCWKSYGARAHGTARLARFFDESHLPRKQENSQHDHKGKVQFGCGFSAPEGWINYDSSPTLRFEKLPTLLGPNLYHRNKKRVSNKRFGNGDRDHRLARENGID